MKRLATILYFPEILTRSGPPVDNIEPWTGAGRSRVESGNFVRAAEARI